MTDEPDHEPFVEAGYVNGKKKHVGAERPSDWTQVAKLKNQAIPNNKKKKIMRHCAVLIRDMTSGFWYYFGLKSPPLPPPPRHTLTDTDRRSLQCME